MLINLLNLSVEVLEGWLPESCMLVWEDIIWETFQLADLVPDFLSLMVNLLTWASNSLKIWSKDSKELLCDYACFLEVSQDSDHVGWSVEDFFGRLEIPSFDSLLVLNVSSCGKELLLPLVEDNLAFLHDWDRLLGFLFKDTSNVNLGLHFVTDLVGNALQDILHLAFVLVDVSRDRPDKLQTSQ